MDDIDLMMLAHDDVQNAYEGPEPMTKQISRDDVERVCESLCSPDVCCPCRDFRHDTAAMLRSLWETRDECERQFQEKVSEIGRLMDQLAAANERLEDTERKLAALRRQWQT